MTDALTAGAREGRIAGDYYQYLVDLVTYLEDPSDTDKKQGVSDQATYIEGLWRGPTIFDVNLLTEADKSQWALLLKACQDERQLFERAQALSPFQGQVFFLHRGVYGCTMEGKAFNRWMSAQLAAAGLEGKLGYFLIELKAVGVTITVPAPEAR